MLVKEIVTGHHVIFSMLGGYLQATVVVFVVIYMPPGSLMLGLLLQGLSQELVRGWGVQVTRVCLVCCVYFFTRDLSLGKQS